MSETERRFSIPRDGQFRTRAEDGNLYIEGYFAVYNSRYDLWDGAYETIAPGAFDGETEGDVRALTNRDVELEVTDGEIQKWTDQFMTQQTWRIESNPEPLTRDDIYTIYRRALAKYIKE